MSHPEFENLLKQAIGLDGASIGPSAIERAVQTRMVTCKLKESRTYWEHVTASEKELQELIEAVVVPETWFFRDSGAFAALTRMAAEEWPSRQTDDALRLLSLPCSTGEEPYSIAMALLDAGFPANRFRIDAVDISRRALAQAQQAVYGKNSFRGHDLGFRERHFEAAGNGHRLTEAARHQVQFHQGNLFADDFLPGVEIYDVIFCRNLLIYFDRTTQDRAINVLERLLTARGVLFVAPSETGLVLTHNFISAKIPLAYAFRKAPVARREENANSMHKNQRASGGWSAASPIPRPRPADTLRAPDTGVFEPAAPIDGPKKSTADMEAATRLANQGRFVEAASYCEEHLRQHGPSAQAFHLLGLLCDATGDQSDAVDYYRKALYLDPNHYEALIHLATCLERQGNTTAALVLRNRARRVEQK
jgi:chemotaxis protein methyltransferase WspC